jgi:hypothetical protein
MRSVLRILSWGVLFATSLAFTGMLANAGQPIPAGRVAVDIATALVMASLFGGQALMTLVLLRRTEQQSSHRNAQTATIAQG